MQVLLQKRDIRFHLAVGMNVDVPSEQPSVPVYMKTMHMHCRYRDQSYDCIYLGSIISWNRNFHSIADSSVDLCGYCL